MKTSRKAFWGTLAVVLVIAVPLTAGARPANPPRQDAAYAEEGAPRMPREGWFHSLAPEKQKSVAAIFKEHREKMRPVRDQLWMKRTLLNALSSNPKVEPKELTALVEEMGKLRAQLSAEREVLADKIEKETGVQMPMMSGGFRDYRHGGPGAGWKHGGGMDRGCGGR